MVNDKIKNTSSIIKDILYIIGLIVAVVLAYGALDKRVTILESSTVTKDELYYKLDNLRLEIKKDIKEAIRESLSKGNYNDQ